MTCREKLAKEHPELVEQQFIGGCDGCPGTFGYLDRPDYCKILTVGTDETCTKCWNREIPGTEEKEKKMTIYEKVFGANFDEGVAHANCPVEFGFKDLPDGECERTNCSDCWKRPAEGNEVVRYADNKPINESPHILDSGNRREFETGAVRDIQEGKGRMDLLPWAAIMEVSKHCENGAKKYGEHNIDKGIPIHSLCDSAARHLAKYLDGWTDEPHLLAAAWNLLWAVQMEVKHPELCDIPWDKKE